jgi:acetyl esterase/lipase
MAFFPTGTILLVALPIRYGFLSIGAISAAPDHNFTSRGAKRSGAIVFQKQTYIYKTVADCSIRADVYRLPDDTIRPALFWLHGGALIFGNRETIAPEQLESYVNAGYVVVSVDYRLAPEAKLQTIIEDVLDAYHWMRTSGPELFQIDPERIGVIGNSAGGYLTLMTGVHAMPRPRALISFYGYGDIVGPWYSQPDPFYNGFPPISTDEAPGLVGTSWTTGTPFHSSETEHRGRFYLYCRQQGIWPQEVGGHDPAREPDWFIPFCPIRNVTPDFPPTLLIHGDLDTDVPLEQSVSMAKMLDQHHVEHELNVVQERGHGFDHEGSNDPLVAEAFNQVFGFLKKHLNP